MAGNTLKEHRDAAAWYSDACLLFAPPLQLIVENLKTPLSQVVTRLPVATEVSVMDTLSGVVL